MPLEFDVRKYKDDGAEDRELGGTLVDGSDSLANQAGQVISFQNIRNDQDVFFKAFITAFNETYSPNFNATEVFGRVDPIQQYKGTTRNITLAWKLPAASESEAYENLGRVQKLLQMLYPSYLSLDNALTLSEAPLVRLKVMNLLTSEPNKNYDEGEGNKVPTGDLFRTYRSTNDSSKGLLGVITSCTVNHNLEGTDGVFNSLGPPGNEQGRLSIVPNTILPKLIDINISFTPLHEQTLGYSDESENFELFPYGVRLGDTIVFADKIERGKTREELVAIKDELEEKRRKAHRAQQEADKAEAAARKAMRKMRKGKELNERQSKKFDDRQQATIDAMEANRDLVSYESEFEDLIG